MGVKSSGPRGAIARRLDGRLVEVTLHLARSVSKSVDPNA